MMTMAKAMTKSMMVMMTTSGDDARKVLLCVGKSSEVRESEEKLAQITEREREEARRRRFVSCLWKKFKRANRGSK